MIKDVAHEYKISRIVAIIGVLCSKRKGRKSRSGTCRSGQITFPEAKKQAIYSLQLCCLR